ncbi:uncharacterized protein METZ01_LOCUS514526, partial [marine metagenome]
TGQQNTSFVSRQDRPPDRCDHREQQRANKAHRWPWHPDLLAHQLESPTLGILAVVLRLKSVKQRRQQDR